MGNIGLEVTLNFLLVIANGVFAMADWRWFPPAKRACAKERKRGIEERR